MLDFGLIVGEGLHTRFDSLDGGFAIIILDAKGFSVLAPHFLLHVIDISAGLLHHFEMQGRLLASDLKTSSLEVLGHPFHAVVATHLQERFCKTHHILNLHARFAVVIGEIGWTFLLLLALFRDSDAQFVPPLSNSLASSFKSRRRYAEFGCGVRDRRNVLVVLVRAQMFFAHLSHHLIHRVAGGQFKYQLHVFTALQLGFGNLSISILILVVENVLHGGARHFNFFFLRRGGITVFTVA